MIEQNGEIDPQHGSARSQSTPASVGISRWRHQRMDDSCSDVLIEASIHGEELVS